MTPGTPGVGIIEPQDWEPLGGFARENEGTLLREPLVTVSPLGARPWAPPQREGMEHARGSPPPNGVPPLTGFPRNLPRGDFTRVIS